MSLNMLMWLTMLTLFVAMLCLAAAAFLALAIVLAPVLALLFTGLGLLTVFAFMALVIRLLTRPPPRKPSEQPAVSSTHDTGGDNRGVTAERAASWVSDNAGIAILGAAATGMVLTASPGLRRFVVRAATPVAAHLVSRVVREFTDR